MHKDNLQQRLRKEVLKNSKVRIKWCKETHGIKIPFVNQLTQNIITFSII